MPLFGGRLWAVYHLSSASHNVPATIIGRSRIANDANSWISPFKTQGDVHIEPDESPLSGQTCSRTISQRSFAKRSWDLINDSSLVQTHICTIDPVGTPTSPIST